jgi:ribosomal protein S18 acetylase RimI-like enzyme
MLVSIAMADVPGIMRIERLPGYGAFIGRWTAPEHAEQLALPTTRYYGWRTAMGGLAGFAIFQKLDQPVIQLRRIAIDDPGAGGGTSLLRAVLDRVFETTKAVAIDLHVRSDNRRAQQVYLREGFVQDGEGAPEHDRMVLTRGTWAALPRRSAG